MVRVKDRHMNVLVVGGAGYIGSHTVRRLQETGHRPVVYDNLSEGHRDAVGDAPLVVGEMADRQCVVDAIGEHHIDAAMLFAAHCYVGESVEDPAKYYRNNVSAALELFDAMRAAGVGKVVFSSSCATYGVPEKQPMDESLPQQPINPYGFTKFAVERMLDDFAAAYGFGYALLRYFNAAGAHSSAEIGEDHEPETHLIPIVAQVALGQREHVGIYGADYPTPDGTCIRDYIHVNDLADAHIACLERLRPGEGMAYNLGIGRGYSVREVIDCVARISGRPVEARESPRRAGDPPELVSDAAKIRNELGWRPQFDTLDAIVETAWRWHESHPRGYDD
jgi:UDP-glucose 4-epimerase